MLQQRRQGMESKIVQFDRKDNKIICSRCHLDLTTIIKILGNENRCLAIHTVSHLLKDLKDPEDIINLKSIIHILT
jgi:hypothetical protein